jgi:hypothetical protein
VIVIKPTNPSPTVPHSTPQHPTPATAKPPNTKNNNNKTNQAFLPSMVEKNHGHVITIASTAGLVGVDGLADYCCSKAGACPCMCARVCVCMCVCVYVCVQDGLECGDDLFDRMGGMRAC